MKKEVLCIIDFKIGNLLFIRGMRYEIEWNPVDEHIYLYNQDGFTPISKDLLNYYFL